MKFQRISFLLLISLFMVQSFLAFKTVQMLSFFCNIIIIIIIIIITELHSLYH